MLRPASDQPCALCLTAIHHTPSHLIGVADMAMMPESWISDRTGQLKNKEGSNHQAVARNVLKEFHNTTRLSTSSDNQDTTPMHRLGSTFSLLPSFQYQENIRLCPIRQPRDKRPLVAVPSKNSIEVDRKRPRSRLESNETDLLIANNKPRPNGLGKRVFSRVKDGVLRSKSVSKRRTSDSPTQAQRLRSPAHEPVQNATASPHSLISPVPRHSIPAPANNTTAGTLDPGLTPLSAPACLDVQITVDIDDMRLNGSSGFWVEIKISAVKMFTEASKRDSCISLRPGVVGATVKVKPSTGFRLLRTIGTACCQRLTAGDSFTTFINIAAFDRQSPTTEESMPTETTIDDLCSEIESLLSPESEEVEVLTVKVTYSHDGLPADTSLVLRRSLVVKRSSVLPIYPHPKEHAFPESQQSTLLSRSGSTISHAPEDQSGSPSPEPQHEHEDGEAHTIWRRIRQVSRSTDHPFALKWRTLPVSSDSNQAVDELAALARANRRSSLGQETLREWRVSGDGSENAIIGGPWL